MVRINLINPKNLADQHLIAEYNEILMLEGYLKKFPEISLEKIPKDYCLEKGHILFFKNKTGYLKKRFKALKKEMVRRGFNPVKNFGFSEDPFKWKPLKKDFDIIKKRLIKKINLKPDFYRYYGKRKNKDFFIKMIKKSD
jgi:deoxyribonuclease (pyrimidine dimer)